MRTFNPKDFNLSEGDLNNIPIRDEVDIEQLVFRQILSTNISASQDEAVFAANVRVLMNFIPAGRKQEVRDRSDEYESTDEHYEYKYFCGVPLGTPEHPINGSPFLLKQSVVDWHALYEVILEILEDCGLTWKFDEWQKEVKKPKEQITPTPLMENIYNAPIEEVAKLEEQGGRVQRCAGRRLGEKLGTEYGWGCEDVINDKSNPGMHHKGFHKLICKKCEAIADVKYNQWIEKQKINQSSQK